MALFKPYSGTSAELAQVPVHDGYAYFTTDDGKLSVDINGTRYTVNAKNADGLLDGNSILTADGIKGLINNLSINTIKVTIDSTGSQYNGVLVDATSSIGDLVKIQFQGSYYGVKTIYIDSVGYTVTKITQPIQDSATYTAGKDYLAYHYMNHGIHCLDILNIEPATNMATIRNKLQVYSKTDVDNKIANINVETYKSYAITISSSGWTADGTTGNYKYVYTNTALKCGSDGNIAPIISYNNVDSSGAPVTFSASSAALDDYAKIYNAVCTAGTGITFYANAAVTNTLTLKILDPQ